MDESGGSGEPRHVDLLLEGADVVDGTGAASTRADIAVSGGRIVWVGRDREFVAERRIALHGRCVAPGFIDAHGHSDIAVLSASGSPSKIHQGVTTEVMGNCGLGVAPLGDVRDPSDLRRLLSIVDVDPSIDWSWRSVAEYLDTVRTARTAMNVMLLAGHLAIRAKAVGYDDRRADAAELQAMQALVDEALRDGACGLSTGLMYPPNSYADVAELTALAEVVASHDAVMTFHMRDYGDHLLGAVEEALTVARRTGCRIQLSHLVAVGRRNWGKPGMALTLIDRAMAQGVDVAFDVYPYLAGSTNLAQLLPGWALEGGVAALLDRAQDPGHRARITGELRRSMLLEPRDVRIAGGTFGPGDPIVGRSLDEVAEASGTSSEDAILDVLIRSGGTATMVAFGRDEDDLAAVLRHPRCLIGSDGMGLDPDGPSGQGQPHPRSYGCYARLLGSFVRDAEVLTLEDAIRRSTSMVAERFRIPDRGVVAPGYRADLVVFDPSAIADLATFEQPQRHPAGVSLVMISGEVVLENGTLTSARPGQVLTPH